MSSPDMILTARLTSTATCMLFSPGPAIHQSNKSTLCRLFNVNVVLGAVAYLNLKLHLGHAQF